MKFEFFGNKSDLFPFKINTDFSKTDYYIIGRKSEKGSPPAPANMFLHIPDKSKILYDIFSVDCALSSSGTFSETKISENQALQMYKSTPLYEDSFSLTGYKRYYDGNAQHTVWIEDAYHVERKLKLLEKQGFSTVGLLVTDYSYETILKLIHTDRYSI